MKTPILPGDSGLRKLEMPERIARLKMFKGIPVPFHVPEVDGVPDFFSVRPRAVAECHLESLCWICGQKLGSFRSFVTSPIHGIMRLVQEPPCHTECAEWTAVVAMASGEDVTLVWTTRSYKPVPVDEDLFFRMGFPEERKFFFSGRAATAAEVAASLERGLPLLREQARQQGPEAEAVVAKLEKVLEAAWKAR